MKHLVKVVRFVPESAWVVMDDAGRLYHDTPAMAGTRAIEVARLLPPGCWKRAEPPHAVYLLDSVKRIDSRSAEDAFVDEER